MRAGKLRQVLTFLALDQTATGAYGATRRAYKPVAEVRGSAQTTGGGDGQAGTEMVNLRTVLFEIRYMPGLDSTMRIEWQGDQYEINLIDEVDGRGRILRITATRVSR